jgi:hypothetical protein
MLSITTYDVLVKHIFYGKRKNIYIPPSPPIIPSIILSHEEEDEEDIPFQFRSPHA